MEEYEVTMVSGVPRRRVCHPEGGESMVKQEFGDSADINYIMNQWKVGIQPMATMIQGVYGDFSDIEDYHRSVDKLLKMDEAFMTLSPYVRDLCGNDPGKFLEMLETKEGLEALRKAGLLKEQEPRVTPVTDDSAAVDAGTVG